MSDQTDFQDFHDVGTFVYRPSNSDYVASDPMGEINNALASSALEGFRLSQLRVAFDGIQYCNSRFYVPIGDAMRSIAESLDYFDIDGYQAHSHTAIDLWDTYSAENNRRIIAAGFLNGGADGVIAEYAKQWMTYDQDLEHKISRLILHGGEAKYRFECLSREERLLATARLYDHRRYGPGMKCSDLIIKAAKYSGIKINEIPVDGATMTKTWFDHGLGDEFKQTAGGTDGITLRDLIDAKNAGTLEMERGAILVTDGHAAIFAGDVTVAGHPEFLLYDANDSESFMLTATGMPAEWNPPMIILDGSTIYYGHSVGVHISHFQWGLTHKIKVFVPRFFVKDLIHEATPA